MSWAAVALIGIGAFVLLTIIYLIVWGIFARKVFKQQDKFFDDDFFDRDR